MHLGCGVRYYDDEHEDLRRSLASVEDAEDAVVRAKEELRAAEHLEHWQASAGL